MRKKLMQATQNADTAFLEPAALDECFMGVSSDATGTPSLVYDLRGCMETLQAHGQSEADARSSLLMQAAHIGAILIDSTLAWPTPRGTVTVSTDEAGAVVAVTRTDKEHRILSVIWERGSAETIAQRVKVRADHRRQIEAMVGRVPRS